MQCRQCSVASAVSPVQCRRCSVVGAVSSVQCRRCSVAGAVSPLCSICQSPHQKRALFLYFNNTLESLSLAVKYAGEARCHWQWSMQEKHAVIGSEVCRRSTLSLAVEYAGEASQTWYYGALIERGLSFFDVPHKQRTNRVSTVQRSTHQANPPVRLGHSFHEQLLVSRQCGKCR